MTALTATDRISVARAAQVVWARLAPQIRRHALADLRRRIAAEREALVDAIMADTGKPALDALAGDVLVTLEQMRYYEKNAAHILAPRRIGRNGYFFRGVRFSEHFEPHGVVLVFGPANYPLQLSLIPAVTALYTGNAVVLKVSERTPTVALALDRLLRAAGIPEGVAQVVCTAPAESAELIDAGPDFVFFTGSTSNGRSIAERAAAQGIPTLLELGGMDAAVVFADCDFDRTVEGITYGAFCNAGQVCVGVKRLYIERPLYEHFVEALVRRASALRVGEGHNGDLGRIRGESARTRLASQVRDALDRGARLMTGSDANIDHPIILSDVPADAWILREECFGPVLTVRSFETEAEAVALANSSRFALGASAWTRSDPRAKRVVHAFHAGSCSVNDVIRGIANPRTAFGGNAASGYGRYHGSHGLYAFSRIKTLMENRAAGKREINWFPFMRKTYNALSSLIELRHRPHGMLAALRSTFRLALLATLLCGPGALRAASAHLILRVHLPEAAHGRVAFLVFNSPDGFPQNKLKAVVHGFSQPVSGTGDETIDIGELPPGRYAVSVYLDENGNGKLDAGFLGIPKEPVGVSNNPRRRMGPPRFEDGAFEMEKSTQTLVINLVRP